MLMLFVGTGTGSDSRSVLFINIFTIISILLLVSVFVYRFVRDTIRHNRITRKVSEWSEFHKQLTLWSSEIKDIGIKDKFVSECIQRLVDHDVRNLSDFSYEVEKQKVFDKWGKHIPSLLQEVRNEKLNKLV